MRGRSVNLYIVYNVGRCMYLRLHFVCFVCKYIFISSEEFSKVQEESMDKAFETSNQPEKTGGTEVHTHIVKHNLIYLSICYYTSYFFLSFRINGCRKNGDKFHLTPGTQNKIVHFTGIFYLLMIRFIYPECMCLCLRLLLEQMD